MRNGRRRTPEKPQRLWLNLKAMFQAVGPAGAPARLFWWVTLILTFCLQVAESSIPSMNGSDSLGDMVDDHVAQLGGNSLRQLCYLIVFAVGVSCFIQVKGYKLAWRNPLAPLYGTLLAWCALSIVWAADPLLVVKRLLGYGFMVTGAAGIGLLFSRRQMTQFITFFGAAGLTFSLLLELVQRRFKPWMSDYRFSGAEHENVQGFCCVVFAVASLAAADTDPRHRFFYRCMAVYGAAFVILTKCRSCYLGLGVALLVYVLLTQPMVTKLWVAAVLLTFCTMLYMTEFSEKLLGFVSRNGEGMDNFTGRVPVWNLADSFISKRPLEGYGFESFWTADHVEYFSTAFGWQVSSAHNGYREILLNLGYVGLILHVAVLAGGVVMGALYYKRTRIPLYALTAGIFAGLLAYGSLESAILISDGPYHFSMTLMLASLCFEPRFRGAPGELMKRLGRRFAPGKNGFSKRLVEV